MATTAPLDPAPIKASDIAGDANGEKSVDLSATKEDANAPPPNFRKRQLIFDSLAKIIGREFGKDSAKDAKENIGDTRGTFVFTWGAGYVGQLGRKLGRSTKKYSTRPMLIDSENIEAPVRQISCGKLHTAAVTDMGTLYTWGAGEQEQLGYKLTSFTYKDVPTVVPCMDAIFVKKVACGKEHMGALSDVGKVYLWGNPKGGRLGTGLNTATQAGAPVSRVKSYKGDQTIDSRAPIFSDLSCGDKHTAVLARDTGAVYTCGDGDKGQLGHNQAKEETLLTMVEALNGIHVSRYS
jgi:E3 ubiquitin-protein ligase HERC4